MMLSGLGKSVYWIGLRQQFETDSLAWLDGSSNLDSAFQWSSRPDCVSLNTSVDIKSPYPFGVNVIMHKHDCNLKFDFICEKAGWFGIKILTFCAFNVCQ